MRSLVIYCSIIAMSSFLFFSYACKKESPKNKLDHFPDTSETTGQSALYYTLDQDINIGEYFEFMDSVVTIFDTMLNYTINEHLIVRSNPWLIDSLENTDYYRLQTRNIFNEDQQSLVILHQGNQLLIPDSLAVDTLLQRFAATEIDINIPEFRLRIKENDSTLYHFPVRVGRVAKKYLAMAGREVDLKTRTGKGIITRINKNPSFINPSDNKRYYQTKRDDGKLTKLPRIPWLEPEIDGHRYGQLIHPTTNPKTLGKAYSNGCIGMKEADMWRLYYYAPIGTKIHIRYDLTVLNEVGDTIHLKSIYPNYPKKQKRRLAAAIYMEKADDAAPGICHCATIGE